MANSVNRTKMEERQNILPISKKYHMKRDFRMIKFSDRYYLLRKVFSLTDEYCGKST